VAEGAGGHVSLAARHGIDAFGVWRLLEVAHAAGMNAASWPTSVTRTEVAALLRNHFVAATGRGTLAATTSAQQVRVRALAVALAGRG
jgi:hypothetical protein